MSYLETIGNYLPDWVTSQLSETNQAKLGVPVGLGIYNNLESAYIGVPSDALASLEQCIYLVSIGIRRSEHDGNGTAKTQLQNYLAQLEAKRAALAPSMVCTATGYGCPKTGMIGILQETEKFISNSNLATQDKDNITNVLNASVSGIYQSYVLWYGVPGAIALGAGYYYFFHFRKGS